MRVQSAGSVRNGAGGSVRSGSRAGSVGGSVGGGVTGSVTFELENVVDELESLAVRKRYKTEEYGKQIGWLNGWIG